MEVEGINCSTIKSLDRGTVYASLIKTQRAVTVENHSILGVLGSAVLEAISDSIPVPVKLVGVKDSYGESVALEDLLRKYGVTTEQITRAAKELLEKFPKK